MSKITFRADDELVEQLETFDASKSEVMREALRTYLEEQPGGAERDRREADEPADATIDDLIRERVDALLADRLPDRRQATGGSDVNVTIALEDRDGDASQPAVRRREADRGEPDADRGDLTVDRAGDRRCGQCGERVDGEHVYCPNCGEKASRRLFCDCGDELRSDWSFCPGCGRRTPAADVLDQNGRRPRES